MKVQVFITHYVTKDIIWLNDMLVEAVTFMEMVKDYPHETIVVYYSPDGSADELYGRLPEHVKLVKDDRPGHPGSVPSMRNKIIDMAEDYFVILQNDIRVSHGWLLSLTADLKAAEKMYGKRCIVSLRCVPYHYVPGIIEPKYPSFWKSLESHPSCLSISKMQQWCHQWNFTFRDGILHSTGIDKFTDDGHQLMMFISSKDCFDSETGGIGYCDENFLSWGYDDSDWGIRALMEGKKNLKSQNSLIGHLEGFTTTQPGFEWREKSDNREVFIKKWGQGIWDEMQTGRLWTRLHGGFS